MRSEGCRSEGASPGDKFGIKRTLWIVAELMRPRGRGGHAMIADFDWGNALAG